MKVLIYDTNLVFARKVAHCLQKQWQIEVDVINDHVLLAKKLREEKYEFIIADVICSVDMDSSLQELREARERGTTIFTWGHIHKSLSPNLEKTIALYKKPAPTTSEIQTILNQFVMASGQYPAVIVPEQSKLSNHGK